MNDMTRVIRQCEQRGLIYRYGRRHPKIVDPHTGRSIPVSGSPSCRNAHRAVIRDLRRYLGVSL